MNKCFALLVSILLGFNTYSAEWEIAEHLIASPPEDLDVTYQIIEEIEPEFELVYGWKGEDLSYIVLTELQPQIFPMDVYWRLLIKDFEGDSEINNLKYSAISGFDTINQQSASCRHVSYTMDGEQILQYVCMIKGKSITYYIVASSIDDDAEYMATSVNALVRSITVNK